VVKEFKLWIIEHLISNPCPKRWSMM
jgi:hypothetical protein